MTGQRWQRALGFCIVLLLVVGGLTALMRGGKSPRMRVTAQFSRTVGLYPGSSVRVLGVKVGTVRSITPDGPTVTVVMDLPRDTPVPADVTAAVIPPSLVSDRYVQLSPVYDSGPRLADGGLIDTAHTLTPVELDDILGSLDTLLVALGPKGANATGSLGNLVKVGAKTLGKGGGKDLHDTITNLAAAMKTLADNKDDLGSVISNLATFTDTLARNDGKIRIVTRDLAVASQQLAGERGVLGEALKNLSVALGEIASLVHDHRADLASDVHALADVTNVVVKHKESLIEALDVLPLNVANLASTINTDKGTLDIRNDNHQGDNPNNFANLLACQLFNINCPPPVPGAAGRQQARPQPPSPAAASLDRLTLRGMFGGAS